MAEAWEFACDACGHRVEAWDDGNPYYLDERGAKRYAYHPDHAALERCIGNDVPHVCLDCGTSFMIDSRVPVTACPACLGETIVDACHVTGRTCPHCRHGIYREDPDGRKIS